MEKQDLLYQNMTAFYRGDPARIQHFVKVHSFAAYIGRQEGLSDALQAVLEAAALVHDIGIRPAEEKNTAPAPGRFRKKRALPGQTKCSQKRAIPGKPLTGSAILSPGTTPTPA